MFVLDYILRFFFISLCFCLSFFSFTSLFLTVFCILTLFLSFFVCSPFKVRVRCFLRPAFALVHRHFFRFNNNYNVVGRVSVGIIRLQCSIVSRNSNAL